MNDESHDYYYSRPATENTVLSRRYRVAETHCLTAGRDTDKTTNVYLDPVIRSDDVGRIVGLTGLDLLGDRSDLVGKKLLLTIEVLEDQEP